jgi:signal transduction histidine kinase
LFFSAGVVNERRFLHPEEYKSDTEKIENILHSLEIQLDNSISDIRERISKKNITYTDSLSTWLIDENFSELSQKGIIILVYDKDSLKFWTDNSVNAPKSLKESDFNKGRVEELDNGWYEIRIKNDNEISYIGLIRLKNNFSFENQYLKNTFRPELGLPSSVRLSTVPLSHGQNIRDLNDEYIFSIVPFNKVSQKKDENGLTGILFFLSFAFLLLYINQYIYSIFEKKNGRLITAGIILLTVGFRYLMVKFKFPIFIYSLSFFEPEIYAGDHFFPFLGDFFINALIAVFWAVNIFRIFDFDKFIETAKKIKILPTIITITASFLLSFYFLFIRNLIDSLIVNSNIPVEIFNLTQLNIFSLTAYLIIALLLMSYILTADRMIRFLFSAVKFTELIIIFTIVAITLAVYGVFFQHIDESSSYVFFFFITLTVIITRFYKKNYRYFVFVIQIFFTSIYIVVFVTNVSAQKEKEVRTNLVTQLMDERDDVAELLIQDVEKTMKSDDILLHYLINPVSNQDSLIYNHLNKKYFFGFWKKYDLEITVCGNNPSLPNENQAENCENYFNNKIIKSAKKLKNSSYNFSDNHNGTITYFGILRIPKEVDERKISLYIKLTSKLISKEIGYPELLLDENTVKNRIFTKYSFAKYRDGKLITKSGIFPYDLGDEVFSNRNDEFDYLKFDNFEHTVYHPDSQNCIVLSIPAHHTVDLLISFAYLFVFFNIILFISIFIVDSKLIKTDFILDFNNKIRFSMLFILLLTFILFSSVTIYFTIKRHKDVQQKEMTDKIQSVLVESEQKMFYEKEITSDWKTNKYAHLDELMLKFSQVFFSDINLYDPNGFLLATSRPEIFTHGLIGRQMNNLAFTQLVLHKKTQFIQNESIGNLNYSSIYIPLKNSENSIIAYINLPYFSDTDNLRKDISALLVTIINMYVVLLLLAVFIAFIISSGITQPLRMLQYKFRETELGKQHQEIQYNKNDEIGGLIKEYNRMVQEMSENVRKLADTERESAWREMAKQIAHEIKNPLTPMKLSVQLLLRSWKDNKEDFDSRMTKVTSVLIEQIDTLSAIASEFSAFAKMPKAQDEEVDLAAKLVTIVQLFENTKDMDISLNLNQIRSVKIIADKEQLSRVFINLIKNGIQAVPEGIRGKIEINLTAYGSRVKVTVKDNGSGIPEDRREKLFIPSFTTKTKGMGMGLAIVKNIINNSGGEIWFESEVGKGTEFFVEFPILIKV